MNNITANNIDDLFTKALGNRAAPNQLKVLNGARCWSGSRGLTSAQLT